MPRLHGTKQKPANCRKPLLLTSFLLAIIRLNSMVQQSSMVSAFEVSIPRFDFEGDHRRKKLRVLSPARCNRCDTKENTLPFSTIQPEKTTVRSSLSATHSAIRRGECLGWLSKSCSQSAAETNLRAASVESASSTERTRRPSSLKSNGLCKMFSASSPRFWSTQPEMKMALILGR